MILLSFKMFLILSLLATLCFSHEIIRSISHYDSSPYILKRFNPNKCYKVTLQMQVSCLFSGSAAFGVTVANLYSSEPVSRLYTSDLYFEDGLTVAKTGYYNRIIIRNSTKLEITKGNNCMNNPLHIDIYKFDIEETDKCIDTDMYYLSIFCWFLIALLVICIAILLK